MSFGRRGNSDTGSFRQLARSASAKPGRASSGTAKSSGGIDAAFIALALGVIAVSAGGALAAPSLISFVSGSLGSTPVRPIAKVVAGLNRDQAKAALAREAFPDKPGGAFMSALAAKFPQEHDRLLGQLADIAMQGADRDGLMPALNEWTVTFTLANLPAIGRTGASGFDQGLAIVSDALDFVEKTAGGSCNADAIVALASDPEALSRIGAFGSEGYQINMRSSRAIVDLAAAGQNAPHPDATLRDSDERALQSVLFALMADKQVMSAVEASMRGEMTPGSIPSDLNVCSLGRVVIVKLKALPADTKSRLLAFGVSQAAPAMKNFPLAAR